MADQEVHAITEELAQVKVEAKSAPSPEPAQQARPAEEDERSVQGLSRRITTQDKQIKELTAKLAAYESRGDAPQADVASAIVQELADAGSKVDYRAEAARLAKELESYKVARQFGNDPVAQRLIDQGIDPAKLSPDLLADIRAAAAESEFSEAPRHNPQSRGRSMSRDEMELEMLRMSGQNPLFPNG